MQIATIERLEREVRGLVEARAVGFSEFELFGLLRERGWDAFERGRVDDHLTLFRQHFLLFHVLYRLRDRLRAERRGDLAISALRIALLPYRQGEAGIVEEEPLRAYYLDLSELEKTTGEDVEALLGGFWEKAGAVSEKGPALDVLGLEEPVDYPAVKRRYRQLAMRHHPDRGGDKGRLQELNRAMTILNRCYGR